MAYRVTVERLEMLADQKRAFQSETLWDWCKEHDWEPEAAMWLAHRIMEAWVSTSKMSHAMNPDFFESGEAATALLATFAMAVTMGAEIQKECAR